MGRAARRSTRTAPKADASLHALDELAALRGKLSGRTSDNAGTQRSELSRVPDSGTPSPATGAGLQPTDAAAPTKAPTSVDTTASTGPNTSTGSALKGEVDEFALFRKAVQDVIPIKDAGRAELQAPKPAPLPRPRAAEPEDAAAPSPPRRRDGLSDDALFHTMMSDVTPLGGDSDRAELGVPHPRHRPRTAQDATVAENTEPAPPQLPSDAQLLSDDELFRYATRGTQPIEQRHRAELSPPPPAPDAVKRGEDERAALRETMEAPITFEDRLEMGEEAAFLRPGLPRRVLIDLRRGRWVLQGELDLHGLNRQEARTALAEFLTTSLQQGRRCVRVIHGKGLGSPGKHSILKQLSRGWLAQREEILAFCQAAAQHGGSGALTVLLRGQNVNRG